MSAPTSTSVASRPDDRDLYEKRDRLATTPHSFGRCSVTRIGGLSAASRRQSRCERRTRSSQEGIPTSKPTSSQDDADGLHSVSGWILTVNQANRCPRLG